MTYAVIKTGGRQYRVSEGDVLDVPRLEGEEGSESSFDQVLLLSSDGDTRIGAPLVDGATVTAEVVAQTRAPKVTAFKFLRRKGYSLTKGHKQPITRIKIKSIAG